jgi:hypothetical protein
MLSRVACQPPTRRISLVIGVAMAGLLVAACGSSSSGNTSGGTASGFAAYRNCLQQHGVTLPTSRPTRAPGSGFGGLGGSGSGASSTFQKAAQACASLRPTGGFGGFAAAFRAFRSCMSAHGEPIPTTRPKPSTANGSSPVDRFLNGLNPDNAKVAAALKACESKLPSFASG